MSIKAITKSFELEPGKTITLETGKLAKQADGAVVVKMGKTMLLATVVSAKEAREDIDIRSGRWVCFFSVRIKNGERGAALEC